MPELIHCYPTFRWDVARGRVTSGDRPYVSETTEQVLDLVDRTNPDLVFAPLAVGRHVDHVIVREIVAQHLAGAVYYCDFPYLLHHPQEAGFVQRLKLREWIWDQSLEKKRTAIAGYRTQVPGLFPGGDIPTVPEMYYLGGGR